MASKKTNSVGNWLFLGFVIPILAELLTAILIVTTKSGAYAEGFAYIVVIIILVIALPITLIGNAILVPRHNTENVSYLYRGMILPTLFIAVILIYYTGFWDKVIHPLFPEHVEKIQPAAGYRLDDKTLEDFFVVHEFTGTDEEANEIKSYAMKNFTRLSRECPDCLKMDVYYYFVPHELYDPIDTEVSKEEAIAVFRYLSAEESTTIEQIER